MSDGEPTDGIRDDSVEGSGEESLFRLAAEFPRNKWSRWSGGGVPLRALYQEAMQERRRLVAGLLAPGEEVRSDVPAYWVGARDAHESDESPGHLLVTTSQVIYVGEDERAVPLRYAHIESVAFRKQKLGWVVMKVRRAGVEDCSLTVLPRTARLMRRMLRKQNPAALR